MDIKTKLRISASVSVLLAGSVGLTMMMMSQQIAQERERESIADEIIEGIFGLDIATGEYLSDPGARAEEQWELRYSSIEKLMQLDGIKDQKERDIVRRMRQDFGAIGGMFSDLKDLFGSDGTQEEGPGSEIASEIRTRIHSMSSNSFELAEVIHGSVDEAARRAALVGIVSVGILVGSTSMMFLWTSRYVSVPIWRLTEEMEDVSVGKLESKVGGVRNDELGRLAGKVRYNLKKLLGEKAKALEELTESNKLLKQSNSDLESYSYVVSHDLRGPLRSIQSFSSFLLADYGSTMDEKSIDYLKRITISADHMDFLIKSLLTLSRVGRVFTEMEPVNLNNVLDEIITDLNVTEKVEVVNKLPSIQTQGTWIKQLFTNLIGNGLKFNKSKIPKIEVMYQARGEDHLFSVRDNGIGIEEKYHERIFNLFEGLHAREKYEGVGAGLTISKKIVTQLGGQIWVQSTPGEGSTFYFTIPMSISRN